MKLVCQGDSITYGYEIRRSAVWTRLFQDQTGVATLNRGENGITTVGMMHRLPAAVLAEKPDAALIMGGGNDILSGLGPDEAEKNLTVMLRRTEKAGIRPLLGIPGPFCPPIRDDWAQMANFPAMIPLYDAFAERLAILADTLRFSVVNFRAGLENYVRATGTPRAALYHDGIHLSEAGHKVYAAILADRFAELGLLP